MTAGCASSALSTCAPANPDLDLCSSVGAMDALAAALLMFDAREWHANCRNMPWSAASKQRIYATGCSGQK